MQYIIRKCSEGKEQCIMVSKVRAKVLVDNRGWEYTTREQFDTIHSKKKIGVNVTVKGQ